MMPPSGDELLASADAQLEVRRLRAEIDRLEGELRELRREEEDLRSQNERLVATIDLLPDATFVVDNEKKVVAWNRAAEELTGIPKEQILGRDEQIYAEPFYGERRSILIDLATAPDPQREATYKSLTRVGEKIVAEAYVPGIRGGRGGHLWGIAAPLVDREGKRFGAIEVFRDVSEFKRTQGDLETSVSLLQAVLDAAYEGILAWGAGGTIQTGNRKFFEMWGLSSAELAAEEDPSALRFVLEKIKEPERFRSRLDELRFNPEMDCHDTLELLDGRVIEARGLPMHVGDVFTGRVWSFHDVTDRTWGERALRQSEQLFKDAFFGIPDLAGIVDAETGNVVEINDGAERVLGWRREEVVGRAAAKLDIWPSRAERARVIHQVEKADQIQEVNFALRRKDGRPCLVSGSARFVEIGGRRCAVLLLRDVTARQRLEEDLRNLNLELERRVRERTAQLSQSEHKYRELVESANSIILRWDTQGRVTFLNEYGQEFFGFREEEILGRNVVGTIVPEVERSGRDLADLMRRIEEHPGEFVLNENENIRRTGERVWIAWTNRPVYDASGKLVETLSVGNDVTALKRAEEELTHAKEVAESADRLKSVFLATMSHELRTPLNSIIGFTGILLQGLAGPLNEEQAKQLSMVQTSARHLHALINDVLDLSKIEAGQLQIERAAFDFWEAASNVLRAMEPLASKKGIELRLEVGPEVGTIVSDRRRVEQVLMNLVSNAIKFTEKGTVMVASATRGGIVETSVRDTGIGIKPEDQKLLFRPFQQVDVGLTRTHEGTGLGLSICRRLLGLLGGTIDVQSEPGAGSTFTFRLPLQPGGAP